jgi:hypothetical protein
MSFPAASAVHFNALMRRSLLACFMYSQSISYEPSSKLEQDVTFLLSIASLRRLFPKYGSVGLKESDYLLRYMKMPLEKRS